jgi:hypothetical protein
MTLAMVCCCLLVSQKALKPLPAEAARDAEHSLCRLPLMEECTSHGQYHAAT